MAKNKYYVKNQSNTNNKFNTKKSVTDNTIPEISEIDNIENSGTKPETSNFLLHFIAIISILALTFWVHSPSFNNELTNWDDDKYVINNGAIKTFDFQSVVKLFTDNKYYMGNYHPLTMVTLAFDYSHSDVKPGTEESPNDVVDPFWFHLSNIIFHLLSTLFIYLFGLKVFKRLTPNFYIYATIFFAALFGVHTLHVESVVWVSERKDVLYMMFFVVSLYFYVLYLEKTEKPVSFVFLFLSLFTFVLSLLSKGQATSLSITLIAIDFLYKRNLLSVRVILEKVPFIGLSVFFGILAIQAQHYGQAIHSLSEYTFFERIIIASYGYTNYLAKLVIPIRLSAIYPYEWVSGHFPWHAFLYLLPALSIAGIIVWLIIKNLRPEAFGLLFYTLNIALLLQFIPVGSAIMADRYAYVPSIGYCFLLGWLFAKYAEKQMVIKQILFFVAGAYLFLLSVLTFEQTKVWRNSVTLWDNVVDKYEIAVVAFNNRGSAKKLLGDLDGAIYDFSQAIKYKPDYKHAIYNRGTAKKDKGDLKGALEDFDLALLLDPNFGEAYHNRGIARDNLNEFKGAIEDYTKALELDPGNFKPYVNRGVSKGKSGDFQGAIDDFNYVLEKDSNNADAYSNRGLAKNHMQMFNEALEDFGTAIKLRPDFADAFFNRAITRSLLIDYQGSIDDYGQVLRIKPNFAVALNSRGIVYLQMGKRAEGCADLQNAAKQGYQAAQVNLERYCK
jgi:protein O-mannosyl-transferase